MSRTPEQRLYRAWLVMALLITVMGVAALAYNPLPAIAALAGGAFCGWQAWLAWPRAPEPLSFRLEPDPAPGCVGGDVGGRLYPRGATAMPSEPQVTLVCTRLCEKAGHQSVAHRRDWLWWETRPAFSEESGCLSFRFEPPATLPATEPRPDLSEDEWRCHHYWTLVVSGVVAGQSREQRLRLRVLAGTERMEQPLADAFETRNQSLGQDDQEPTDAILEA
ncbi:MAG: hypothetical protein ACQERE_11620 [Pseudomonadota bacterium]